MKKKLLAALLALVTALTFVFPPASAAENLVTAVLEKNEIPLNAELYTGSYGWNWNRVSPISDFVDYLGRYTIAYTDGTDVYIYHIDDSLKVADTLKIQKPMPLIGGVTCDSSGNFYIACGQYDKEETRNMWTFAVYKYDKNGNYSGKAEFFPGEKSSDTCKPFDAGNCAMAFHGDLLICSYAKLMYNGHQANAVYCVDTTTMTEDHLYNSYTSHSFNQAVLPLSNDTVVFADHGDAYPRGISITISKKRAANSYGWSTITTVPFHFYGITGENYTNARLTGIAELGSGIALVGSSAKTYSSDYEDEKQQLFMQILDKESGESILDGSTRVNTEDKGIIWLTDYTDGSEVKASAMAAMDSDRLLVLWEQWKDNSFVNSYYSIISSDGKVLKEAIPMQHARVNGAEELKLIGDRAYWTYADLDTVATVYRLDTSTTSTDILKDAVVSISEAEMTFTGKALKPTVTVLYNGKALKNGTDYTVSYKNNTKPGQATAVVNGKGAYSGSQTVNFIITPKKVQNYTVKRTTYSKNTLSWSKSKYVSGYEIMISKYEKKSDGYYWFTKQVTKTTSKNKYTHIAGNKSGVIFKYCVRPFVKINGEKVYGEWSDEINPYWR